VVLSNNDGCAISRSDEAKMLGVQMGAPGHLIQHLVNKHDIAVFSSNYTLYGDLSERVMITMADFVPHIEIYSIDEAFLDLHALRYHDPFQLAVNIRKTVRQYTGIPISIGIASTKTLAKMANRFAKKKRKETGIHFLSSEQLVIETLEYTAVEEIWGIGRQYAQLLLKHGFKTAADLVQAPDEWIRKNLTVVGQRLLNELRGRPSIEWEGGKVVRKNICTSRSFGYLLTDKDIIREAISNHAASCALKLRKQGSCAQKVHVLIQTNVFRPQDDQYLRSVTVQLPVATNNTTELIRSAIKAFEIIFRENFKYQKCGVTVMDLVPEDQVQSGLFDKTDRKKDSRVLKAMDTINNSFGKERVRFAVQGYEKKFALRAQFMSGRYTTHIDEILVVKI
jgi:DNA polymerase V